eukprot:350440-Chlamydomonas_euryale.AAC.3
MSGEGLLTRRVPSEWPGGRAHTSWGGGVDGLMRRQSLTAPCVSTVGFKSTTAWTSTPALACTPESVEPVPQSKSR